MKKEKEWLKEAIEGLISKYESFPGKTDWNHGYIMALHDYKNLINQLDEPKTLSQEWVDENVVEGDFRGNQEFWYGRFIEEEKVRNLLVPKQEKIVIPQFVADWYEENLSGDYTNNRNKFSGNDVIRVIEDVLETNEGFNVFENYGIDKKIATWAEENEEDFIHLIVNCSYKDGYEVKKEPVYYAKIKGHELVETETVLDDDTGNNVSEFHRNIYFVLQRNGELIIDMKDSGLSGAKHFMTMNQWNNLGINETNADFEELTASHR